MELNIDFPDIDYHGGVRFDDGLLNAIYIYCTDDKILKFEYIDNDFIFTHIYIDKHNGKFEYRYDAEMNLVAKYASKPPDVSNIDPDTNRIIIATKIEEKKEKVNYNYISVVDPNTEELLMKDFTDYFNILEKYNMVVNNNKLNNKCHFFFKENNENVIYLILDIYG